MGKVLCLAWFTFVQGIKERFFAGLLILLLLAFLVSEYIGLLSLADPVRVVTDLSTSCISFLTLALTLFFAITFLYKEREEGMLHLILSRPLSRSQYLMGRFAGFLLLLVPFLTLGFLLLYLMLLLFYGRGFPGLGWLGVALFLQFSVVLAFAVLSSVFFSEQITALLATISFYVVCQLSHQAALIVKQGGEAVAQRVTLLVERVLPSFALYDPFEFSSASAAYKATLLAYTALYVAAFLLMAAALLERKDI